MPLIQYEGTVSETVYSNQDVPNRNINDRIQNALRLNSTLIKWLRPLNEIPSDLTGVSLSTLPYNTTQSLDYR